MTFKEAKAELKSYRDAIIVPCMELIWENVFKGEKYEKQNIIKETCFG